MYAGSLCSGIKSLIIVTIGTYGSMESLLKLLFDGLNDDLTSSQHDTLKLSFLRVESGVACLQRTRNSIAAEITCHQLFSARHWASQLHASLLTKAVRELRLLSDRHLSCQSTVWL